MSKTKHEVSLTNEEIQKLEEIRTQKQKLEAYKELDQLLKKYNFGLGLDPQSPYGNPLIILVERRVPPPELEEK